MSGNINKNFELMRSNCNLSMEKKKKNVVLNEKFSNGMYYSIKAKDSSSDTNQSQASSLQSDSRFPSPDKNIFNSDSDSTDSEKCLLMNRSIIKKKRPPPIGVFWDIENCQVPKGRSAVSVARLIRDLFFTGYREAEFVVVCDVKKESSTVIQELNDAQVTLIHVASTCKNAADEKLRQALRRFADTYGSPAAVILISGDINFAADLSDLKHRKKLHVILIHKENAADALILCASEHYCYTNITQTLPLKEIKQINEAVELVVKNLPKGYDPNRLRNRLRQLSDNCGGRVVIVSLETGTAVIRFNNIDAAVRAQRRMDGEDVYGSKISVSYPNTVRNWEKSYSPYKVPARKVKNQDVFAHSSTLPLPYHPTPTTPSRATGSIPKNHEYMFHSLEQFEIQQQQLQQSNQIPNQSGCFEGAHSIRGIHSSTTFTEYTNLEPWRPHSSSFTEKRSRTPNENVAGFTQTWSRNISGSFTALNTIENDDDEIRKQIRNNSTNNSILSSIELHITNLDQSINQHELKCLLLTMFQEFVMVLGMSMYHQVDGNLVASVQVSTVQDAQYIISKLHRSKVGHKKIVISYAQTSTTNPHVLRSQVIALLQEVPGNKMPLFKFRELLETRFKASIPVSELYKLRDICSIKEEFGGRVISLNLDSRTTSTSHLSIHSGLESPYCTLHCPNSLSKRGWAEPVFPPLPNIIMQLKKFTEKVHELLKSHMGILPLPSFPICYEQEFGEKLLIDDAGVPLEHLITCVSGVDLRLNSNLVKYVVWSNLADDTTNDDGNSVEYANRMKSISPPLSSQLNLFSRELVDLLKTSPHCQLLFGRFIPAYHHHFGRQCRVADYGYTRLVDLIEALTHVVQLIGEGNRKILTLAHPAQMRRFTSDLLRVLKAQVAKQLALSDFFAAYEKVLGRPFDPVDYGLCDLSDLLSEVSENNFIMNIVNNDVIIAIPKKEQTREEIFKTKKFSIEVVDLLRHAPQYGLLFNKFVPAYHQHFGHQCRVSDYGFTKLVELFEAIPNIVKIEDAAGGERKVSLTAQEAFKVVQQQILYLVNSSKLQSVPLAALSATFLREFGYPLRPEVYDLSSVDEIVILSNLLELIKGPTGLLVIMSEESDLKQLALRVWSLLLNPPSSSSFTCLLNNFQKKFKTECTLEQIEKYRNVFEISYSQNSSQDIKISLTNKYAFAARLYNLLFDTGGTILLGNLDGMYQRKYGSVLRPSDYDSANLNNLLQQFPLLFVVRGRRHKRHISLNTNITDAGIPLPFGMKSSYSEVYRSPPPANTYFFNSERTTTSPPKSDTPPSHNLCFPLPRAQICPLSDNPLPSISPMKNLLPAIPTDSQNVQAPDPSELPMPNADLLNKYKTPSPSKDSGISSTSFCNSVDEPDSSTNFESDNSLKRKRNLRLAAHFTTPLNKP